MQWKIVSHIQAFWSVSCNKQDTSKRFYDTKLRVKPSSHRIKNVPEDKFVPLQTYLHRVTVLKRDNISTFSSSNVWKTNNIEDRQLFMANKLFQCIYYKKAILYVLAKSIIHHFRMVKVLLLDTCIYPLIKQCICHNLSDQISSYSNQKTYVWIGQ